MTRSLPLILFMVLSAFPAITSAQETRPADPIDLSPGFKMRSGGGIDIGDIYAEVVQFGPDWKETEQHDVFNPTITTPDANSHLVSGTFTCPAGSFNLTEHVANIEGGISLSADVSSPSAVQCNELSIAFTLPVSSVGGKQLLIDGQPLMMPLEPAKKGEAHLLEKENAGEIDIPTPSGTLTIRGNFTILVQDDREWGDKRYALRVQFTPGTGAIRQSKIDMQLKWKPAGAQ